MYLGGIFKVLAMRLEWTGRQGLCLEIVSIRCIMMVFCRF